MVMYSMIKLLIILSTQKWNPSNILPVSQYQTNLESIQLRRCNRKLCPFHKVFKTEHSKYLFDLISVRSAPYVTRTVGSISLIKTKHNLFKNSFFSSAIIEWNNVDPSLRISNQSLRKKYLIS